MSDSKPVATSPSFSAWVPHAVAVVLLLAVLYQARQVQVLQSRLQAATTDAARLRQSNALGGLRLTTLEARDAAYAPAKVVVAWDRYRHQGVISTQNLPAPLPGHDYQLWVLDPSAPAPVSAGLITPPTGSRLFVVGPVGTTSPGFAITLEPGGGSPTPTLPILLAVAPAE